MTKDTNCDHNLSAIIRVLEMPPMHRRSRTFQSGLLAAVLAATLQFVLLAGSLSGAFAGNGGATAIHAGQCSDAPGGHHHDDAACVLCPVCLAITLPCVLPPVGAGVPAPAGIAVFQPIMPGPAQVLASRVGAAAYPRGPPQI
jgi:hypothetical protein